MYNLSVSVLTEPYFEMVLFSVSFSMLFDRYGIALFLKVKV
jgi:hypothetical protein